MDRLTDKDYCMEVCNGCDYYGEPNGCNHPNRTCKVYDMLQDFADELNEYYATGFTPEDIKDLKVCMDVEGDGYSGEQTVKDLLGLMRYRKFGITPEWLKEFDNLYLEKCNEINRLNAELAEYKNLEKKGLLLKLPYLQGNYVFYSLNGEIKMSGYSNPVAAEMIYRALLKEEDGQALERMSK